jgi:ankyrin repeat protein
VIGRRARLATAAAMALLVATPGARAQLALFGSYWENVARAAAANDAGQVRQLLDSGKSPNDVDDNGRPALDIAVINGNLQIAAILIKAKAQLGIRDRLGNTPLHLAAEHHQVEMAKLLIDVGAPVDAEDRNGVTPLMIAARRGYLDIVDALLAKGANPRKTDFTGHDAQSWAADSHRTAIIQALQRAAARR